MINDVPKKAYLSTITVTNIYQSFYLQDGGKFFSIYADTVNLLVFLLDYVGFLL